MKQYTVLLFLLFWFINSNAQVTVNLNAITNGTTQTGCAFDFYDSGASYGNNENYSITFNSNNVTNTHIRINFANFDIDPSDTLYIYDGPNISSPLIGAYNNNHSLVIPNNAVQASMSNISGDLTLRFKTNGSITAPGWFATVICIPQCQQINPNFDLLLSNPLPNDSNYIDICMGEIITFAASADNNVFPENDILYHQDAVTSQFLWDFGDGVTSTGQIATHTYTVLNGYNVYLSIIDGNGCSSTQQLYIRVRIAGNPIVTVNPPTTLCIGDVLQVNAGSAGNSTVVTSTHLSTVATEVYDSTTFIPDGPMCSTQCYGTPVIFNSFPAGATIQAASDIESICINMEHSFAGDLGFTIFCPNGQNVVLDANDHTGYATLGLYYEPDGSSCNAADNIQGTGWTYCWSEIYSQQGLLNVLDASGTVIDSTNQIAHTNYFTCENPLSGLIGCPLNGTWSIQICDDWGSDNGYVFYWTLTLQNQAQTAGWTYEVGIDHVDWTGHSLTMNSDSAATILADSIGIFPYTVTVYDDFGCTNSANFNVEVVGIQGPILGADVTICSGVSTTITAAGGQFYSWSNGGNTASITVSPLATTPYTVSVMSANGCTATDNIVVNVTTTPVANAGPDSAVCTLNYQLQAVPTVGLGTWTGTGPGTVSYNNANSPNAVATVSGNGLYSFTWTEDNGNSCISSDIVSINFTQMPVANAGPDINVCQLNSTLAGVPSVGTGTWTQTSGPGTIIFTNVNDSLSGVSSTTQGTYSLLWTEDNGNGCISSNNMILTLTQMPITEAGPRDSICSFTYPQLQAAPSVGTGTWSQLSGPGFSNYSGQNSPNSNVTTTVYGDYQFIWTENNGNGCVDMDTVLITFNYIPTSTFSNIIPLCFGDSITIIYTGDGQNNAQYTWIFTNANIISGNSFGPYIVNYSQPGNNTISLTVSQHGCVSTTTTENVISPPLLTLSLSKTDVTCYGAANGSVFTTVNGGTVPYSYLWTNGSVFSSINSANPGNYSVVITDYNGCTVTSSIIVLEPAKLSIDVPDFISICNDSTISITASTTGGVFPYAFQWNSGSNNQTITVSPDTTTFYTVLATDANLCTSSSIIEVFVWPPVSLNASSSADSICPGEVIVITASATGGNNIYSYTLNGMTLVIPITIYPSTSQSYQVLVHDGCNYEAQIDIPITVYLSPPNQPSSDKINGCTPALIQFNEQSPDSDLTYIWDFGDGEAGYVKNPAHIFNNPGTFDVSLTTMNSYGCKSYNFFPDWITAYPVPHAQFEPDPPIASLVKPIITFINYSELADSVMWYFGDGDSSSIYKPTHRYPTYPPGIYDITLITFSSYGCSDTVYGKIEIKDELTFYAPTAFSPDNDNINEMFFVYGSGIDENTFQIIVYDRWGEVIFESKDMKNGWDGRVKGGDKAPIGSYPWISKFRDFKGIAHEKTGSVTLIR